MSAAAEPFSTVFDLLIHEKHYKTSDQNVYVSESSNWWRLWLTSVGDDMQVW